MARTRRLVIAAVVLSLVVVVVAARWRGGTREDAFLPVTEERLANELVGDQTRARCVLDALDAADVDPNAIDVFFNDSDGSNEFVGDPDPDLVAAVDEAFRQCSSATIITAEEFGGPPATVSFENGIPHPNDGPSEPTPTDEAVVRVEANGELTLVRAGPTEVFDDVAPVHASNR